MLPVCAFLALPAFLFNVEREGVAVRFSGGFVFRCGGEALEFGDGDFGGVHEKGSNADGMDGAFVLEFAVGAHVEFAAGNIDH